MRAQPFESLLVSVAVAHHQQLGRGRWGSLNGHHRCGQQAQAQAQLEREGVLRQRRLGALGTVDAVGITDVEPEEDEAEEKPKEKE